MLQSILPICLLLIHQTDSHDPFYIHIFPYSYILIYDNQQLYYHYISACPSPTCSKYQYMRHIFKPRRMLPKQSLLDEALPINHTKIGSLYSNNNLRSKLDSLKLIVSNPPPLKQKTLLQVETDWRLLNNKITLHSIGVSQAVNHIAK